MRKRILFCNEASFLSTGFSTYGLEVLKRLHSTGKYDLAEFGAYGAKNDARGRDLPWQYFTTMPDQNNQAQVDAYNSKPTNQFGEWKFEETCLTFKPDVVCDIRDWWMLEYQERSPFRPYFHWAIMPTVDAAPQDEQWIATYMNADAVFTYSDWGLETLQNEGGGLIKTKCSAPPGADLDTFKYIEDKKAHKQRMGLPADALVIGTVMRNQKRKLFPDLLEAFAQFMKMAPQHIAERAYLYLHTSYPDLGWDIPRLVRETGVSHRVLFTYLCQQCGASFPSHFQDAKAVCRACGNATALLPNSFTGVSRKILAEVTGMFDCYVQYAICEGFGMPQVDAAACGVPVFAVDYSAMSDVVRKLGGFPIKVQRFYRESETHCRRALPDNSDLIGQLIHFLSYPEEMRVQEGLKARQAVERHYTWDKTAKAWEDHFDSFDWTPRWASPAQFHQPVRQIPSSLSNEEFVRWGIQHIAGRPELINSYLALRLTRDLNWGSTTGGTGGMYYNENSTLGNGQRLREFNRQHAAEELLKICNQRNTWERRRTGR